MKCFDVPEVNQRNSHESKPQVYLEKRGKGCSRWTKGRGERSHGDATNLSAISLHRNVNKTCAIESM